MMNDDVLRSYVAGQLRNSIGGLNSDISTHRAKLMERYLAEPYGDEVEGRSRVVMSDIADTVEWIMPELMDIFTSGDDAAEFKPVGKEDEPGAKQETAVANYVVEQNGKFLLFYQWFKDALLQKNGVVKSYWDERTVEEVEEYEDLTQLEMLTILSQIAETAEEIEIIERSWEDEPGESGLAMKVRATRKVQEYKIVNVPPEEFLISSRWNSIDLEGCPFVAHKASKTVSELIEMGFDRKQVESLPDDDDDDDQEEIERFDAINNSEYEDNNAPDPSMREVQLTECYVWMDRNQDGVAELLQVYLGGGHDELMRWAEGGVAVEEVDQQPFDAITPVLMSHKFFGRSVAELVEDLQRIRTVLVRQMLDNVYNANNMRPHIDMNMATEQTVKDLLNNQIGFPVRGKGPMAGVQYPAITSMIGEILGAVEYVDSLRENRTGVTKYNQGLDADSLNKTATGIRSIMSASQKKILLIARIFAETGVKGMFLRMHRGLRKGPIKKLAGKIRNEWVEVNPRLWKERTDMTVNVGLGTGDKDQIMQRLLAVIEKQKEAFEVGLATRENILHSLHKFVETAGFKAPELFFSLGEPPQQGDGGAAAIMQIEMQKTQQRQAEAEMKAQIEMQKADRQTQIEMAKLEQDRNRFLTEQQIKDREIRLKEQEVAGKFAVDQRRLNGEHTIDRAEVELKAREVAIKEAEAGIKSREVDLKGEDMGLRKRAMDMDERDREVDEERASIADVLAKLAESNAMLGENLKQGLEGMGKQIAEAQSRPRKVVYDDDGNVAGVE